MRQYWRERKKRERYSEMMKERGGWEIEGELCTVKMERWERGEEKQREIDSVEIQDGRREKEWCRWSTGSAGVSGG